MASKKAKDVDTRFRGLDERAAGRMSAADVKRLMSKPPSLNQEEYRNRQGKGR